MNKMARYLLAWIVIIGSTCVTAQESLWKIVTKDRSTVAEIVVEGAAPSGLQILSLFAVEFSPQSGCRGSIRITRIVGDYYGNVVERISSARSPGIIVKIDKNTVLTARPAVLRYENGIEFLLSSSDKLLGALSTGTTATVEFVPEAATLEFPIAGASVVITAARHQCLLEQ